MTLRRPSSSRTCLYLMLGAWRDVWEDPNNPNTWAVGTQPVSHYLVKSAARRVLLLGLRARDSGFSMVHGRQPATPPPAWLEPAWVPRSSDVGSHAT